MSHVKHKILLGFILLLSSEFTYARQPCHITISDGGRNSNVIIQQGSSNTCRAIVKKIKEAVRKGEAPVAYADDGMDLTIEQQ